MTDKNRWTLLPMYAMSVNKDMMRRSERKLKEYGLSRIHVMYIAALDELGSATLSELSSFLHTDKANTTRAISSLRKQGCVYDDRKTESGRKYKIYLTEKGNRFATGLKDEADAAFNEYLEGISDEEILTFEKTFEKIYAVASRK